MVLELLENEGLENENSDDDQTGGRRRRKSRGTGRKVKSGKRTKGRKGKKRGTKKLRKTLSKWISHVKKFAKMHHMKYPQALKDPKCKQTYRK